jgi:hypothetical protein
VSKGVAQVLTVICSIGLIACFGLWVYEWLNPSTESLKYAASKAVLVGGQLALVIGLLQLAVENKRLRDELKNVRGER